MLNVTSSSTYARYEGKKMIKRKLLEKAVQLRILHVDKIGNKMH